MREIRPISTSADVLRRAEALDALDAVLPFDRREFLAGILSDDDVETLRHLARQGIGENSMRALASDLAYLEAWCRAATADPLPWPAPEALLLKFLAHHLWDPARRTAGSTCHRAGSSTSLPARASRGAFRWRRQGSPSHGPQDRGWR